MNRLPPLACLLLVAIAGPAGAQETFPSKPLRMVVPFPPGGATDIIARDLGLRMGEAWRQQVVIDNRGGANGIIGVEIVAKARPDGYTLVMGSAGTHSMNPGLYSKLSYDALKDFAPVALGANLTNILVVNTSLPAKSVKELIALSKSKPGSITYASTGNGSAQHLSAELLKAMSGADLTHIQYKGAGAFLVDIAGGQISMSITALTATLPFVQTGRMRALGVASSARSPALPDVPTIAEAGVPGYESANWVGIFAPAGTPAAVVNRLNAEIVRIQTTPEMKARLLSQGGEFAPYSPAEFATFQRSEIAKWGKVIKATGAKLD
jgi:tripartite-type tricarboxylate transporter receptor subunit TctC